MKIGDSVRQGDVLLIKVAEIKAGEPVREDRGIVLAHGEATGHAHIIEGEGTIVYEQTAEGERFIKAVNNFSINHQKLNGEKAEHDLIPLNDGNYQQGFQVEDFGDAVVPVID